MISFEDLCVAEFPSDGGVDSFGERRRGGLKVYEKTSAVKDIKSSKSSSTSQLNVDLNCNGDILVFVLKSLLND